MLNYSAELPGSEEKGEINKEEDGEIDEKPKRREKEHEADVWKYVYSQEECGNGKAKGDCIAQMISRA